MNKTENFLKSIDELSKVRITDEVMDRLRQSLIDYLAVTCAGAEFQKDKLNGYWEFAIPEDGAFRAIGTGKDLALKETVFLNGLNAHALDFDDGTNSGIIHLGSPIYSVLIPLAQRYDIGVEEMLKAAALGYETSYTMAVSIQPLHKALGYHATGTCGVLGATIAASYMLGFTAEERLNAFSAASVAASGMLKALDEGSELKPYNVAKSALFALTSLQLAKAGFKGSADPLGGRGFLKIMTGRDDIDLKPVLLDGTYAVQKAYVKPYASCRYTHPAVEAAISVRGKIDIGEIQEIEIKTYDLAIAGHDHTDISGSYSAKMSIPYATAVALVKGKAGLREFSEDVLKEEEIIKLAEKVRIFGDDELSKAFPKEQTAILTVRTKDGEQSVRVDYPKGEPENSLTPDEFKSRYNDLMDYAGIGKSEQESVYDAVYGNNCKIDTVVKYL